MLQEKLAQLGGVTQAVLDADQEGFEISTFGMSRPPARGTRSRPSLNHRPIEAGKEGSRVGDQRIGIKQSGDERLVKEVRSGSQSRELLWRWKGFS